MGPTTLNTTDYTQFRLMDNNREVNLGHVQKLIEAIEENGNMTQVQPVLVNERMEIIDGQHRFTACRELGQPVFYTVVPGLNITDSRIMNILQKGWTTMDFAKSYAQDGNENYEKYLEIIGAHKNLSHSSLILYITNTSDDSSGIYKDFRTGRLIVNDVEEIETRIEQLEEVVEAIGIKRILRSFATAMLKAMNSEHYDHERMVRKAGEEKRLYREYANKSDNLRMLEDMYNLSYSERNRTRLF